ncbi:MAG: DUF58 domain-containing protein [Planctomycetaceae bacterium]
MLSKLFKSQPEPTPLPETNEQTVNEILRKVQRIRLAANRSVNDLMAGQYKSVFRGRGMEFDEVREYQPGDDVRTIDWNVTAREGKPYIKRFCEERELTVMFVFDISASGVFGSGQQSKLDLVVEVCAMLMFSAIRNNDKVGLVTFADDVQAFYPPRKGKSNVLRLIRELVAVRPMATRTRLDSALEFVNRVQKRRSVVFIVSDFLDTDPGRNLAVTQRRHDVIAVTASDPREHELPNVGFITLRDPETGALREVDTASKRVRDDFRKKSVEREETLTTTLNRVGVDRLSVMTDEPYAQTLQKFFRMRERRSR